MAEPQKGAGGGAGGGGSGGGANAGGAGNGNAGNQQYLTPQINGSTKFGSEPSVKYSRYFGSSLNQRLLTMSTPSEKMSMNNHFGNRRHMSIQAKAEESYMLQKNRIHITDDWKQACIGKELEKIQQLQEFLAKEREKNTKKANYFTALEDEADMKQANAAMRQ